METAEHQITVCLTKTEYDLLSQEADGKMMPRGRLLRMIYREAVGLADKTKHKQFKSNKENN